MIWQINFLKSIVFLNNNLDLGSDVKSKLKILVQNHMSRLLMKIDEENQSISEKSVAKEKIIDN